MASNILSGDRRCGTVRGKMTVLGKLPKPINLPSQKLENRGLDPNVEIVPKGTLTWGSKSSAPTPNAWASSALSSPHTDGSSGSPVNGRPSSGGGVPRPSTAGSDRSHEPASGAWGPNSRPSSASGILATNQMSLASTRPQSAETRPGSSQLSRFAENSSENTTTWAGATGTAERGGSGTSKTSGFTLSSGDFPTLGSEKNSEHQMQRGHSSQGRPTSASSSSAQKEVLGNPADGKVETGSGINSCNMETYPHVGGGPPPNNENWQRNPMQGHPYPSANMPPPQFDAWQGPPVRPPDGIWYTVGTAGGPFRPAGPPGCYPIDHVAFYPSQHPGPMPNSQSVPRPGTGLGVHYLKSGDPYRPQLPPDSYLVPNHPVISVRPGVYQRPPYDGYLGPRASLRNPKDREVPTMGTVAPDVYNQFNRNGNVQPGNFFVRPDMHPPIMVKEQGKPVQVGEIHQGPFKVLLKQHDSWEAKDVEEKREQSTLDSFPHSEGRKQFDSTTHEDGMKNRRNKDEDEGSAYAKAVPGAEPSHPASDWKGQSSISSTKKSLKDSSKISNERLVKTPENTGAPIHDQQSYSVVKKNASLMEKIEVLNNKVRNVDGDSEGGQFSLREVKNHKVLDSETENPVQGHDNSSMTSRTKGRSVLSHIGASKVEKVQDGKVIPQPSESQVFTVSVSDCPEDGQKLRNQVGKKPCMSQGQADRHAEPRLNSQVDDKSIKRTSGRSSSETVSSRKSEIGPVINLPDCRTSLEMSEKQDVHHASNAGAGSCATSFIDYDDHQRAKLKELATQRAKQLQKEEEERTKEQKAKALAKLEELNRRSLAQGSDQNSNEATPSKYDQFKQDSGAKIALSRDSGVDEAPFGVSAATSAMVKLSIDNEVGGPNDPPLCVTSQESKLGSGEDHETAQDLSLGQDADMSGHITHKTSPHFHENNFSKHKRLGYRRKQNTSLEKNLGVQPMSVGNPGNCTEVPVQALADESLPVINEMPFQHKKKNNRTTKNKAKMEETLLGPTLPSSAQNETKDARKIQSPTSVADVIPDPSQSGNEILKSQSSKDEVLSSHTEGSLQTSEEQHGRMSNQWKPQPSRKTTRYQQTIRIGEKSHGSESVWAPVKPQYRSSPSDEASQKNRNETSSNPSTNSGHDAQNGVKTKRAEMEIYVPKSVARELSNQNSQQNSSTINQTTSSDVIVGTDSVVSGFTADSKNGDNNKPNRRSKTHASRRQQNSDGLPSFHEGSVSSYPANPAGEHHDQHHLSMVDSGKEEQLKFDDHNPASIEPLAGPVLKDHNVANKQRYPRHKPTASSGNTSLLTYNKVPYNGTRDKGDGSSSELQWNEPCATDALGNAVPHFGSEYKKPHWQPKSQINPQSNRHGHQGIGKHRAEPHSGQFDKDPHTQNIENSPQNEKNNLCTVSVEIGNASERESKQEMKAIGEPSKDPTHVELPPQIGSQQQQPVSSTFRRDGDRFNRGQESIHRGRDSGQDVGRQNSRMNGGKMNKSQFEYQQTGSYNKARDSSQHDSVHPETREVPRAPGSRPRGRGQNNFRRGGHFRVGASHF
ncbi:hypothetical protein J5N97_018416 [Dioscorea zingiberensis]|uniref:BAT2 N-terminal domain-containing protein n=1 Tax=Dioscorea zingiberensis TaxID=325984 RepID=A0A9D5CN55_9LILI|nr:hypothetical protein J5N97_018416 [Dioscorea zingiberensis]